LPPRTRVVLERRRASAQYVVAIGGNQVTESGDGVAINGRLLNNSIARVKIGTGARSHVAMLAGTASWESRYFRAVSRKQMIGVASLCAHSLCKKMRRNESDVMPRHAVLFRPGRDDRADMFAVGGRGRGVDQQPEIGPAVNGER